MTTTELIAMLKSMEFGGSGRPREISFTITNSISEYDDNDEFIPDPDIVFNSSGDGCAGAEVCFYIVRRNKNDS